MRIAKRISNHASWIMGELKEILGFSVIFPKT